MNKEFFLFIFFVYLTFLTDLQENTRECLSGFNEYKFCSNILDQVKILLAIIKIKEKLLFIFYFVNTF